MTGLLSPQIIQRILHANSSSIKDIPVDPSFMKKADSINEIFHKGAIPIEDRAKVKSTSKDVFSQPFSKVDFSILPALIMSR
jgi:hypothetical protein